MSEQAQNLEYERPYLYPKQYAAIFDERRFSLIEATVKSGKAQPLDAVVWTPDGPRLMGDIKVGDFVCTPSGFSEVLAVYPQGIRKIYRVRFNDGTEVRCDAEHLWEVHDDRRDYRRGFYRRLQANPLIRRRKDRKGWPQVLTLRELQEYSQKRLERFWIPEIQPVYFPARVVSLDPYLVGVLIGDGGLSGESTRISSIDLEIIDAVRLMLPIGHRLEKVPGANVDWAITAGKNGKRFRDAGMHIRTYLRTLGLLGKRSYEKFIPEIYRINSIEVRRSVLQGILDTDGSVNERGQPILEQTSERLARDITELVQSLGGSVYTTLKLRNGYKDKNGKFIECRPVYRQCIRFVDPTNCFRLNRKRNLIRLPKRSNLRRFESIEFDGEATAQCIKISDERGLYLTDGFIPTHNTSGCIIWLIEKALSGQAGQNFWWIAPVNVQAEIAFRRTRMALPRDFYTAHLQAKTLTLLNGTIIWFKSGDHPDGLYGEDVYAAVIDEASRFKQEAWHAVRSTLTATRGQIRIIGNVKGKRGWFYQMARRAEHDPQNPDIGYHKIVASDAVDAGVLEAEEIEQAKHDLPENVFRELYLAEPSDDGGNPFGMQHIRACVMPGLSSGVPRWWGWDLAKRQDYTVGIALDAEGKVCRFERFQHMPWDQILSQIVAATGHAVALVDSTGVGDPILDFLQKAPGAHFEGYHFTQASKQKLMEGLAVAIQGHSIGFPDGVIAQELDQFEYEITRTGCRYTAPPGYHDDCVIALALAVMHKSAVPPPMVFSQKMVAQIMMSGKRRRF